LAVNTTRAGDTLARVISLLATGIVTSVKHGAVKTTVKVDPSPASVVATESRDTEIPAESSRFVSVTESINPENATSVLVLDSCKL